MANRLFNLKRGAALETVDATPVAAMSQTPPPNSSIEAEFHCVARGVTSDSLNVYIIRHA